MIKNDYRSISVISKQLWNISTRTAQES